MDEEQIKRNFRASELRNRIARFHALSANAHALMSEDIAPADRELIKEVAEQMRRDALELEKIVRPGYWQRLWTALWGR